MTFAAPQWAYLLLTLPVIALFKIMADARAQRAVSAFASSERLRTGLLGGASPLWSGLHFGLQLLALAFFIIALTRPQLGIEQRDIQQSGRNILIAMDTSKSMLAPDVKPDRLTRARLAAQDLLEKLPGDRVGLIAFAGRAFLQAPLTTDHEALVESIQALDHTTIPRGGSSLASAIQLAVETVEKIPGRQHGLIIFSDGQETDDATLNAARLAAEKNVLILAVGVGTDEGDVIPDPESQNTGDYVRDENGQVVHTRLESGLLRDAARITGGSYVELASQALTQPLINRLLERLDSQVSDSRQETRHIQRYQWPLGIGILLMGLSLFLRPSSRKRVKSAAIPVEAQAVVHHSPPPLPGAAALLFLLLSVMPAAGAVQDEVQKAERAYEKGQFEDARDRYARLLNDEKNKLPRDVLAYGLGAATFQLKDYDRSARAFSQSLESTNRDVQQRSLRGLATTLYNRGDATLAKEPESTIKAWTDSLAHFETALKHTPGDKELEANRDFVKKRLEELKQQQEEQKQKDKSKEKQKGEKGEGEPEEGEEGAEPQDGEPGEQKETDAMQQGPQDVPEGQLAPGEAGQPEDREGQGTPNKPDENQRNEETGFSPQEARSQLRNYADDQKSVQYLMRREQPEGGKDY